MSDEFTASQLTVLAEIENNRLTIIRAGPGTGKTRVFVEALRRELSRSTSNRAGIAALSFTNVAHEVISKRLGRAPGAPHFVGTLDAFLWRFVVRPFGHLAGLTKNGPTLIPSPLDEMLSGPQEKFGPENRHRGSIFRIAFTRGSEDTPELFHQGERFTVIAPYRDWNLKSKKVEWASHGRVTHSDSQYLASCILRGPHRESVIDLLARRFPTVLVDEFQDTGWFLTRALLSILASQRVRGAVVGDPDQAIYQFGGGHRGLFNEAQNVAGRGASVLEESHRCPPKVCAVATALSRSGQQVVAKNSKPEGRAILLAHHQNVPELHPILTRASSLLGATVDAVLARKGSTVKQLAGSVSESSCPWKSGVGHRLTRAVGHLLEHEPTLAARLVRRELCELLLGDDALSNDAILKAGIGLCDWRALCHAILMEAASVPAGETWNCWLVRVKKRVDEEATRLGKTIDAKTLGARFKRTSEGGDAVRKTLVPSTSTNKHVVLTVHQAKGREFGVVLFYIPKPHGGHSPCPSDEWWSADASSEEREVAFVACSRAWATLVVAVHKKTLDAFRTKQRAFYDRFEVHDLDLPAAFDGHSGPGQAPGGGGKERTHPMS